MTRIGDWMQTATGQQFWPLDPRPDEVDIVDIALSLSKLCRYGGHCLRFYSVAEHSVLVSQAAPPELKKAALLHDASEAYLGDVIRPLKRFIPGYADLEEKVMQAVFAKYGMELPLDPHIKFLDNAILMDELAQVMAPPPASWHAQKEQEVGREALGCELHCWRPETAAERFLDAWLALGEKLP